MMYFPSRLSKTEVKAIKQNSKRIITVVIIIAIVVMVLTLLR